MRYLMLILLLSLLLVGVSCTKKVAEEDSILETLDISECADNNKDTCCEDTCTQFCRTNGKIYTKHIVNGDHCPCWCD